MERENRAYEFRIFPTQEQETFFRKSLGLCRLFWNLNLTQKEENRSNKLLTYKELFSKYKPEALVWMKDVSTRIFANEYMHLTGAYKNFFDSCKKQRKGKFSKPPKLKSKKNNKDSFTIDARIHFKNGGLWISNKIEPLQGSFHSQFVEGIMKNVTIRLTPTGKWFAKILVEKKKEEKNHNGKLIGIDWNCKSDSFLTMSNGTKIKCPEFLRKKQNQLARKQKTVSRRYKIGQETQSNRYKKAKFQVAKFHEKVAWQRKDWLHKLSRDLANKYEFVAVEDINLQKMAERTRYFDPKDTGGKLVIKRKGKDHGKEVGDQGFGILRNFIAYKGTLVKVPAPYTSQTCSICGNRKSDLTLEIREWICPVCGSHHDRDINAARNIAIAGSISTQGTWGKQNARGGPSSSMKRESLVPSEAVNATQ